MTSAMAMTTTDAPAARRETCELPATREQLRTLAIACSRLGLERDAALRLCARLAGVTGLESRRELTARQASHILDVLGARRRREG